MIVITTFSLIIYFYSLILILKDKRYYDRIHALFYIALISLLVHDINVEKINEVGYNCFAHIIVSLYSLYAMHKHFRVEKLLKKNINDPKPMVITWEMLQNIPIGEKNFINSNKIKTYLLYKTKEKMIFNSSVHKDTIPHNYVNDFHKKNIVLNGSCVFCLIKNGNLERYELKENDTIEINPFQQHWFYTIGEEVSLEVICYKP